MLHIIGAGPAGISLAYYSFMVGAKDVCLYEKTSNIGGLARSWKHHDFVLDTGPHIFHTDDEEIAEDWKKIGNDLLVNGRYNSCNILSDYPSKTFHYPLSIQTLRENLSPQLFSLINDEILTLADKDNSGTADNFNQFMEAKVGKKLTEMFFTEYPKKVWGIDTELMLADWAPQRIELRDENAPFYNKPFSAVGLKGTGCFYERIIELLSQKENFRLLTNKNLTGIEHENNQIKKIVFNDKEVIQIHPGDYVLSTIPATNLAKLFNLKLDLNFRGVRSQYFFFNNERILPEGYNWVYCSDKNVSFNRITEPSTMTSGVSPKGYSYVCVETTFPGNQNSKLDKSYEEFKGWLDSQKLFNNAGYIPELNTENFERYVYPIQDQKFRASLTKYNSLVSQFKNLCVLGTGGEFHYSDMQIIFRKSKSLVSGLFDKSLRGESNNSIPSIKNLESKQFNLSNPKKRNSINPISPSTLHDISKVPIPLIAEIGINHNGDMGLAKKMMMAAKSSGAHFSKFQYYKENSRVEKNKFTEFLHETADGTEMSLNDIFERSRLNKSNCIELIEYSENIKMPIFFTVFDIDSAFEINNLGQKIIKVASMDCNNLSLHKTINSLDFETIIISTGMSDISEVLRTITIYDSNKEILLMSCRSSYPASFEDIDLGEINYLIKGTNCTVGYSDHTEGNLASLLAVASGAKFIERHFTTNKFLPGPDNRMSIDSKETAELSNKLQIVSNSIKSKRKIIHPCEQGTFSMQKKSMRFPENIKEGQTIHTDEMHWIAPPEGFSLFQARLPRTRLRITKNVLKGDPVTEDNVQIIN